jgi:hypothetical protein
MRVKKVPLVSVYVIKPISTNLILEFFSDGITELDELFFNTQKNRQLLELSQIIPHLKNPASDSRPLKRSKTGQ